MISDSHVEEYLKKLNGQDADISFEPQSNVEQYLAKMNGLDVELPPEPESRVEALLADFIESGGGGGGNPNYVETIEGTLANPWGKYTASELFSAARSGDLTMYITADVVYTDGGTAATATMMFFPITGMPTFGFTKPGANLSQISFARLAYSNYGALNKAVAGNINTLNETQELLQTPSDTACTLTIIYHPLPSGS